MNATRGGGRVRRLAATLSLLGLAVTGAAGVGAYEILHASSSSATVSAASSGSGLGSGSGSSMTRSGGS
jgi:hypothetical protein